MSRAAALVASLVRSPRLGLSRASALCLIVAAAGAAAGRLLHLPGGSFTGALLATAAARLLDRPVAEPPSWLRTFARVVLGLTIGAAVTPDTLRAVARALLPVTINIVALVFLGIALAWTISRLTHMDLPSALCAATPGALAAMVSLADDLGGDSRVVASMHLVRLVSILLLIPTIAHSFFPQVGPSSATAGPIAAAPLWALAVLIALGLVAAVIATRLRLPGGEILATMAVAAVANQAWLHLDTMPAAWPLFAQWVIGAGVGVGVTRAVLRDFRPFALAGLLMTAVMILAGLGLGWLLLQTTSLDPVTAFVGSTPGGADQMVLLAGELGADAQLVAAMHVARQVMLMLLLPLITRLATRWSTAEKSGTPRNLSEHTT
ncbi:MAG: AbrB family transcriptional regulator [Anaerolineae bacterium]